MRATILFLILSIYFNSYSIDMPYKDILLKGSLSRIMDSCERFAKQGNLEKIIKDFQEFKNIYTEIQPPPDLSTDVLWYNTLWHAAYFNQIHIVKYLLNMEKYISNINDENINNLLRIATKKEIKKLLNNCNKYLEYKRLIMQQFPNNIDDIIKNYAYDFIQFSDDQEEKFLCSIL